MRSSRGPSGLNEFGYSAISRSTAGSYPVARGAVAERLGRGLQSLLQRFESARRLHSLSELRGGYALQARSIFFAAAETFASAGLSTSCCAAVAMSPCSTDLFARPKSPAKRRKPTTRRRRDDVSGSGTRISSITVAA